MARLREKGVGGGAIFPLLALVLLVVLEHLVVRAHDLPEPLVHGPHAGHELLVVELLEVGLLSMGDGIVRVVSNHRRDISQLVY